VGVGVSDGVAVGVRVGVGVSVGVGVGVDDGDGVGVGVSVGVGVGVSVGDGVGVTVGVGESVGVGVSVSVGVGAGVSDGVGVGEGTGGTSAGEAEFCGSDDVRKSKSFALLSVSSLLPARGSLAPGLRSMLSFATGIDGIDVPSASRADDPIATLSIIDVSSPAVRRT